MLVTVAICTWNRSALLDQTLCAMRELIIPDGVSWELLVVNNNSTDDTDAVLTRHAGALPIRRLFEPVPGHSRARNLAASEAKGELIIWTDDDVQVDSRWLTEYVVAASTWPEAAFFGGTVDPWFEEEPPAWIRENLDILAVPYAIRPSGDGIMAMAKDQSPVGANMALRAWAMQEQPFDTELGHTPGNLMGCEEISLINHLRKQGHVGVWVGSARVRHFIPGERMKIRFLWRRFRDDGRAEVRIARPSGFPRIFGAPRWAVRQLGGSALNFALYYPSKGPRWIEALRKAAFAWGVIRESRVAYLTVRGHADQPSDMVSNR